jgi:hypothetical protein
MLVSVEALPVTPVPVDLRLWHRDVTLGWKTVAQAQAELDAEPESRMAQKIRALATVPSLVHTLITELRTEHWSRCVLLTLHRDVVVHLQDLCREQGVNVVSLYPRTPEKKRTTSLRKFHHTCHYPLVALQLKGECQIGDIHSQEWVWIDGLNNTVLMGELPGRTRLVKINSE